MFNLKRNRFLACILSVMMVLFACPLNMVSAKDLSDKVTPINILSKDLITGKESSNFYYEGIEKDDKAFGYSSCYVPENVAPKVDSKSIIGSDDRFRVKNTTTFPYSAICYVEMTWPDGARSIGSAWMYGPDVAVTAGHCLYSNRNGGWAKKIVVYPGRNGLKSPFGSAIGTTIYTPKNFTENRDTNFDWGLIKLDKSIGNTTGYFGAYWQAKSLKDMNVDITGYPGEKRRQMWKMNGHIEESFPNKIRYVIDTTGGQSGCPVYLKNGGYKAIAIHTNGGYTCNKATRITKGIFDFIGQFR